MTMPFPSLESADSSIGHLSIICSRGLFELQGGSQPAARVYCSRQLTTPETYIGAPVNNQIRPDVYSNFGFYNTSTDRLYAVFDWEDTEFNRGYKVQVVAVNPRTKEISTTIDLTSFFGITPATDPNFVLSIIAVTENRVWLEALPGPGFTNRILIGLNVLTLAIEVNINLTAEGIVSGILNNDGSIVILSDNYFTLKSVYYSGNNDLIQITGLSSYNLYVGATFTLNQYTFISYFPNINEYWCTFNYAGGSFFANSSDIDNNLIVRFTMTSPGVFSAPVYDVPVNPADVYSRLSGVDSTIKHPTENRLLAAFNNNNYNGAVEIEVTTTPTIVASYGFNVNANPGQYVLYSNFNYFTNSTVISEFNGITTENYQQNGAGIGSRVAVFTRNITSEIPSKTYSASYWGTQLATTVFVPARDILESGVYVPDSLVPSTPTYNTIPPSATPIDISSGSSFLTPEFTIPINEVVWFSIEFPDGIFSLKITPALPKSLTPLPTQDPQYYNGMTPEYWTTIIVYNSSGEIVGFNGTYNQQAIANAWDSDHWPVSIESTYPPGTYYIGVSGAGIYFENNIYCDREFDFTAAGVYGDTIMRLRFMFYAPTI